MSYLAYASDERTRNELDGYVRPKVYRALSTISSNSSSIMNDNVDLKYTLFLTPAHLRNLRRPLQEIAESINPSADITVQECERLGKVKDCIDLIKKKVIIATVEHKEFELEEQG